MGKVRRYKKKLSKAVAGTNKNDCEKEEQSQQTDYLELAEELLRLKKDDDKMSISSVMKSVKSNGDESLKLKKDAKRYLKHAFLLKKLETTQNKLNKKKKKNSNKDNDSDDDDNEVNISNQKVLNWPTGNTKNIGLHNVPAKKHRKGCQKKLNAQLVKDLELFSKNIKKQFKHPVVNKV